MDTLTNVTITKVFEKKSGNNKYGPWTAWDIYVDDPDWKNEKFSYFSGGNKPIPAQGMFVQVMEFETEIKGEYTNNNVKKLVAKQDKPKPKPAQGNGGQAKQGMSPLSMYVSYVKDLQVARINRLNIEDAQNIPLSSWTRDVALCGKELFDMVEGGKVPEKTEDGPPEGFEDGPEYDDSDEIPF